MSRFGNLLDGLVGLLDYSRVFFILTQIEILAELALATLEFTRQLTKFLFFGTPLAFRHGHGVLFQIFLQTLQLLGHALELLVALGKLAFQLLGSLLCRRRVAENTLGVFIANLQFGGISTRHEQCGHQGCQDNGFNFQLDTPELKRSAHLELEDFSLVAVFLIQRLADTEFERANR